MPSSIICFVMFVLMLPTVIANRPAALQEQELSVPVEFAFVLDGSDTVDATKFETAVQGVKGWPQHFWISEQDSRVAVIQYADQARIELPLTDNEPTINALQIAQMNGHGVKTDVALIKVKDEVFNGVRSNALKMVIIATAGASDNILGAKTIARLLRNHGALIYALFIGNNYNQGAQSHIEDLTDNPERVFQIDGFKDLVKKVDDDGQHYILCDYTEVCVFKDEQCNAGWMMPPLLEEQKCVNERPSITTKQCDVSQCHDECDKQWPWEKIDCEDDKNAGRNVTAKRQGLSPSNAMFGYCPRRKQVQCPEKSTTTSTTTSTSMVTTESSTATASTTMVTTESSTTDQSTTSDRTNSIASNPVVSDSSVVTDGVSSGAGSEPSESITWDSSMVTDGQSISGSGREPYESTSKSSEDNSTESIVSPLPSFTSSMAMDGSSTSGSGSETSGSSVEESSESSGVISLNKTTKVTDLSPSTSENGTTPMKQEAVDPNAQDGLGSGLPTWAIAVIVVVLCIICIAIIIFIVVMTVRKRKKEAAGKQSKQKSSVEKDAKMSKMSKDAKMSKMEKGTKTSAMEKGAKLSKMEKGTKTSKMEKGTKVSAMDKKSETNDYIGDFGFDKPEAADLSMQVSMRDKTHKSKSGSGKEVPKETSTSSQSGKSVPKEAKSSQPPSKSPAKQPLKGKSVGILKK